MVIGKTFSFNTIECKRKIIGNYLVKNEKQYFLRDFVCA